MSELSVKNISKSYKKRKVVNKVSFEVKSGAVIGLLGPNGAGKTTSFYMAVGLVSPDKGKVFIDKEDITSYPMYQRARAGISYLPQEPSIFRKLTVYENICVAFEAIGVQGSIKDEKIQALIEEFGLHGKEELHGYSLSGGERRRVEIARALASSPKFVLLDEPFAGIDPIAVADIQNIILKLKEKGIGVLITDHNVRETLGICDQAYILKDGEIQLKGSAEEIANSEEAKKFYLGKNFQL